MTGLVRNILFGAIFSGMTLSGLTVADNAEAAVIVQEKTTYYPVTGTTGREISKGFKTDKRKSGYQHLNSNRHPIAYVHIELEVGKLRKTNRNNYCRITDADIIIKAHYLFPNWTNESKGSNKLKRTWREFMDYVVWHEEKHVEFAKRYAQDYIALLRETRFPILGECNVMPESARKKRAKLIKALKAQQAGFDRRERQIGGRGYKALISLGAAK